MTNECKNVDKFMNEIIDEEKDYIQTEEEKEFDYYCKLYEEKFGKHAYIAEPSGTRKETIDAIKTCLEKNEDLLEKLLYPNCYKDMNNDDVRI